MQSFLETTPQQDLGAWLLVETDLRSLLRAPGGADSGEEVRCVQRKRWFLTFCHIQNHCLPLLA